MLKRIMPYCTLLILVFTSTVIVWLPFLLRQNNWLGVSIPHADFSYIYKHFDGPLYIIPAKTGYDKAQIREITRDPTLPQNSLYYAAHLPFYPLFIHIGASLFGYLKSMLSVTLLSSMLLALLFYFFVKRFSLSKKPLLLTILFLFFPRLLVVRSVGAPEPLFLFLLLGSLLFFERKNMFLAGLLGALATMTKSPGILLFIVYLFVFLERKYKKQHIQIDAVWILLIPLGLCLVFLLYAVQYGDFFAYFKSGDNIHLLYPFAVFNASASWVGTGWLEDVLFLFFLFGYTVISLYKTHLRSLFYFSLIFFVATLCIQHRDISRYSLPLVPMLFIALERLFVSKKFIFVSTFLFVGIFFYAWNFIAHNYMPITEWLPFL